MTSDLLALQDRILLAALPQVAFDGWSRTSLEAATAEAGLQPQDLLHAFPGGVTDAVAHFSDWADRQATAAIDAAKGEGLKTHQRVALGVRARLEAMATWREAARKATAWLATPRRAALGSRLVYRTTHAIWRAAGDTATDFNFYSKRGLLAGVVVSTTLFWLQDRSEDSAASWRFLDRRIGDVLKLGGAIGKTKSRLESLDPTPFLRRFQRGA
jgi:ubiquinone biosynthesis protein COQ9